MKQQLQDQAYDKLATTYKKLGQQLLRDEILFRSLYQAILRELPITISIRTIGEKIPFMLKSFSAESLGN